MAAILSRDWGWVGNLVGCMNIHLLGSAEEFRLQEEGTSGESCVEGPIKMSGFRGVTEQHSAETAKHSVLPLI